MDALSFAPLDPGQVTKMHAPEHLCPAYQYGSSFERGLRVDFGDRSHLYVSGTPSIDREGNILHPCDVRRQTERTLENIDALIHPQGASFRDMAYGVAYVLRREDAPAVRSVMEEHLPKGAPVIVVGSPICRPGWQVEIEAMFVRPHASPYPPFL